VARSPILEDIDSAVDLHAGDEVVLRPSSHTSPHSLWCALAGNVGPTTSRRERAPNHQGIRMFRGLHSEHLLPC
jgi:hypothetical protein